jgi:hypothetical protein
MTQNEIIEMASKSGLAFDSDEYPEIWQIYMNVGREEIVAFAKLVAQHEREECAVLVDSWVSWNTAMTDKIAAEIRARGA